MMMNFLWFGGLRNIYTNPVMGSAFSILGQYSRAPRQPPVSSFSVVVLFVAGAIYLFGRNKRRQADRQCARGQQRHWRTKSYITNWHHTAEPVAVPRGLRVVTRLLHSYSSTNRKLSIQYT